MPASESGTRDNAVRQRTGSSGAPGRVPAELADVAALLSATTTAVQASGVAKPTLVAASELLSEASSIGGRFTHMYPASFIPGMSVVDVAGCTRGNAAVHYEFAEIYEVLDGTVSIAVQQADTLDKQVYRLERGDKLSIPAGNAYQVLEGSPSNRVRTTCIPGFDAADSSHSKATVMRAAELQSSVSPFCGKITHSYPKGYIAPMNAVDVDAFTRSTAHVHREFTMIYEVLNGTLELAVQQSDSGAIQVHSMKAGDKLAMGPGNAYKVIGGSDDNRVRATCVPEYRDGDSYPWESLDKAFPERSVEATSKDANASAQ